MSTANIFDHIGLTSIDSQTQTLAEQLSRYAHASQTDKAGQPYIGHVERVVRNLLRHWPNATGDEVAAAWLHDVIEDTTWDEPTLLRAGIAGSAVNIVKELTRPPSYERSYLDWIYNLAQSGSLAAVKVKLADNEDNSNPARVDALSGNRSLLERRYIPARKILERRLEKERSRVGKP